MDIRKATKSDLSIIRDRLGAEYKRDDEGFFSNFNWIEDFFSHDEMWVAVIEENIAGFLAGPMNYNSILNVWEEYRGKGVGSALAEEVLREGDDFVFQILCKPVTSAKFWQKAFGFCLVPDRYPPEAWLSNLKENPRFNPSKAVPGKITIYHPRDYKSETAETTEINFKCSMDVDGYIQADADTVFSEPPYWSSNFGGSFFYTIEVDGQIELCGDWRSLLLNKRTGIRRDRSGMCGFRHLDITVQNAGQVADTLNEAMSDRRMEIPG